MERLTYDFCVGSVHCNQVRGADNLECGEVCQRQDDDGCATCPIARAWNRRAPILGADGMEMTDMDSLQASRIAGGNTAYTRNRSDFYPTPPEVTVALMKFLDLAPKTKIWEPACGDGHMVHVIEAMGYQVIGTDIQRGDDFLTAPLMDCDWIITNPPFSQSEAFIQRCIEHRKPFCMLLKSQYWHAKRRKQLFDQMPPEWILPLTWRPDFLFGTRGSGSPLMDVMWNLWDPDYDYCNITRYLPLERPSAQDMQKLGAQL